MTETNKEEIFSISKIMVDSFIDFSGDYNPLHSDKRYSARTPFGQIVVPGVSVILLALSRVYPHNKVKLHFIEAEFKKPLFLNSSYFFRFENHRKRKTILIKSKTETLLELVWEDEPSFDLNPYDAGSKPFESHLTLLQEKQPYIPNLNAFDKFNTLFELQNFDRKQICALSWCSYFVGMVYPGKQALFSKLKLIFENHSSEDTLTFGPIHGVIDDRFSLVKMYGSGNTAKYVELTAFQRPQPVQYYYKNIVKTMSGISAWKKNLNVLVLGGSRGLGSVFVQSFAYLDFTVSFTYRDADDEAARLEKDVREDGKKAIPLKCDLETVSEDVLGEKLKNIYDHIDVLVLNASPRIWPGSFLNQTADEFSNFIQTSIQIVSNSLRASHPFLAKDAIIIFPSSVYVNEGKENYSHYVAAKSALEGMLHVLSKEWPTQRFIIASVPRILTDQTNTSFPLEETINPLDIVKKIIEEITHNNWQQNYVQLSF